MSNMTIECEFMAGTTIEEAIIEANQKAISLDVAYVSFNFNGVLMNIGKHCFVKPAVDDYQKALKSKKTAMKMVCQP